MKIKLPIAKLREFVGLARYITSDNTDLMPILKYIKIEIVFGTCIMTKANSSSFVKYSFDIEADDYEFLVEEVDLNDFVSISQEEKVTITFKEKTINVYDGYNRQKWNIGDSLISDFVKIPADPNQTVRLERNVIDALSIAKVHVGKDNLLPRWMYVYMTGNDIYSSAMSTMYIKSFSSALPTLAISAKECGIISEFEYVDYSKYDNFNIYKNKNIIFGFKAVHGADGYDYKSISNMMLKQNYITIRKTDLINFCTSTRIFAKSDFCTSRMDVVGEVSSLIYEDKEKGRENVLDIPISLVGNNFSFHFNPPQWLPILKALPYDEICIGNEAQALSIWNANDNSYIGSIFKIHG